MLQSEARRSASFVPLILDLLTPHSCSSTPLLTHRCSLRSKGSSLNRFSEPFSSPKEALYTASAVGKPSNSSIWPKAAAVNPLTFRDMQPSGGDTDETLPWIGNSAYVLSRFKKCTGWPQVWVDRWQYRCPQRQSTNHRHLPLSRMDFRPTSPQSTSTRCA